MMEHYVTLFDSLFLPQGLALHMSMQRHAKCYTLWILCVDELAYESLQQLALENVRLLKLEDCETQELKRVKPSRSNGEYCWTLTPFAPRFVFEADSTVSRVTYVDADLWFLRQPDCIFDEFLVSRKNVLITWHGYDPDADLSAVSGRFCVQFMTFTREGEPVRQWWQERCIEWCFARSEGGKFGDQKYLDDWPERFPEHVHVGHQKEWFLAPWNATRFPYSEGVVWHFHGLRVLRSGKGFSAQLGGHRIPAPTKVAVYEPYFSDLRKAINLLESIGLLVRPQTKARHLAIVRRIGKQALAALRGLRREFEIQPRR